MVFVENKEKYLKVTPKEVIIAIDPSSIKLMRPGRAAWFNSDGSAKSVGEMDGRKVVGPDDGDMLG